MFGQGGGHEIVVGGCGKVDEMGRWLAYSFGQGRGYSLMAASGDGHVLGGGVDEVEGCLVCLFSQGGRCGVVVVAG